MKNPRMFETPNIAFFAMKESVAVLCAACMVILAGTASALDGRQTKTLFYLVEMQ